MKECWKKFLTSRDGVEYAVSNYGRIKNITRDRVVKVNTIRHGNGVYRWRQIRRDGKTYNIARLVAETFVPNPEGKPEVDHIDRNPLNNRADNLRWVTRGENNQNRVTVKNLLLNLSRHFSIKQISEYTGLTITQVGLYLQDEEAVHCFLTKCDALEYEES